MTLIRCPKCDAICNSTDTYCRSCGNKLNNIENKQDDVIESKDNFNSEVNSINSLNNNEPEWVKNFKNQYKVDRKIYCIGTIIIGAIFLVFLFLTIFNKKIIQLTNSTIEKINVGWLFLTIIFGILALSFFICTLLCNMKTALVEVVDGYYVLCYGRGYHWTLYIENQDVDSSYPFKRYWSVEDIMLRGTLPNNQKIIVTFGDCYQNFMKVQKVVD